MSRIVKCGIERSSRSLRAVQILRETNVSIMECASVGDSRLAVMPTNVEIEDGHRWPLPWLQTLDIAAESSSDLPLMMKGSGHIQMAW